MSFIKEILIGGSVLLFSSWKVCLVVVLVIAFVVEQCAVDERVSAQDKAAEYVEKNDFQKAYEIIDEANASSYDVARAHIDYLVLNGDFRLAVNVAKDRLHENIGHYGQAVLANLVHIYKTGGEKAVIEALGLIKYPIYDVKISTWGTHQGSGSFTLRQINAIYLESNQYIEGMLRSLTFDNVTLSSSFKRAIADFLLPTYEWAEDGNHTIPDYTEVKALIRKYHLK